MNPLSKLICLCCCLLITSFYGNAQQLNWAHSTGSPLIDVSQTVHTDNAGDVYIAGKFSGTNIDFDPSPAGSFLLSSVGSHDGFVAKYSPTGQFIWAFRYGGANRDGVICLTIDNNNNFIYITGYFRGSNVDFDPGPGTANLTSNGDAGTDPGYGGDMFVAKYTLAGAYQWAFNVGGADLYDSGLGIATDAAGGVYVGGYFTHTVDFNPGAGTAMLNSANGGSMFLAKYTPAGAYQWAFNLGSGTSSNSMFDLTADPAGNVYATGYYQGTNIDFDPGPGTALLSSSGGYELFVAKYNANGQYQFAFDAGGSGSDVGRGIAVDNAGNVYVIGDFNGANIDFDPGPGVVNLSSNGQSDIVLAKYNSTGQYQWAFNFGGTPPEFGGKVVVDGSHLFVSGNFSGTADMNPSAAVDNLTSAGLYDIFVGKYTLNGEYLCSFRIGGPRHDNGYAVYSPSSNVFYLTGAFPGTNVDFDPGPATFNLSSAGDVDIYLAKYSWPDNSAPAGTISGNTICSGDQGQLTFTATAGTGPFTIVYNNGTNNVTVTNVQSGVPFNIVPNPAVTTTYTLVSIRDANRCSETRFVSGVTANVTVNSCTADCFFWPVFGLGNHSAPIPFSNNVSFSFSNPALLIPNSAYSTMTPGNWFTPNPTIATTSPPNATAHNPADIGIIDIYPTTVNDQGTISFSSPTTTGFFLHIYQTVSRLDFDHSFSVVSSDGDLHVGNSGTLTNNVIIPDVGPSQSPDDANATIFFPAGITQLKFTITSAAPVGFDGIKLAFTFPDDCTTVPCTNWLSTPSNGSKVVVGDLDITGNQVTVEALFNRSQPLNSGAFYGHLVSKHTDQSNINYSLFPNGCSITTDVSGYKETFQTCLLDLNRVYHVAMVYNGSSLKYYRDGLLISQVLCTGNMINNNLATTIGQVAGGADLPINQFLGYINEIRIWNVERTQNQLQTYMNTPLPNPTAQTGLKAYYSFNDLLNKQGNTAWNGSLAGAASISQTNPNCSFTPEICSTTIVTPGFTIADTVCVNTPVTITNTSVNATTSYWNFCSGSLNLTPAGSNFTSPGLSMPAFTSINQDGNNFYAFVVNHTGSLARMSFGNSLLNTPVITDLGSLGVIPFQAEGIDIEKDGANWIGYIIGGQNLNSRLVKLNFGTSLANVPVGTNLGNIGGLAFPKDFTLFKNGTIWYGFTVNGDNNTVTKYNFGNSLNNMPVPQNLGNIGSLNYPVGIFLLKDINNYHLFITNRNSHTISRLDFGTSLANTPTGINLGNPANNFNWPRDITVRKDCDKIFGFVTNEATSFITRLDFNNNLLSIPSTNDLGNIGNLNFPCSISEIFRTGDAVNFFIPNISSNSVSRITFNNCSASSIPSFTGQTPPPFQYTQPGVYNVSLFVDDGLATQSVICKQIVVKSCLPNVVADFDVPDTVCVNTPVNITNTSTGATTSYWNFCVANINSTPGATNLGNIGNQFQLPVFIDYTQYNGNYYGFVTNNTPGKLTRLDFGNSLLNTPTAVNLGNVGGIIPNAVEEIQLAFNEGKWYAIIVGGNTTTGGSRIVKLDFGPDLTNTSPVGTNWGNIGGLNYPGPLHLFNDNGNWYAFTVDAGNSVIRFSFGSSFQNPPTAVNFGNIGGLINTPDGINVISDNGQWYAFITNRTNSLIRLDFGNSLLNTPTAVNLGNPNNRLNLPRDIYVMKFCNELVGFVVNEGSNDIVKLNFTTMTSVPAAVSLGNIGNLSFPHSISKIFRVGPDLYSFILNVNNNTITRLNFTGCTNSSIPNHSGANPPPITYTSPGTYNINLTIDDGLPTQSSICKQVVVKSCMREISGVINDYTEVLAFDPCKNTLTVADAAAYNTGDTVLLIQMKGAVIDSTNTAAFGNVTDYKNAGNYEFNYVKSKTGNSIELKNILTRQYDIPYGKVQLVRVPYYQDAVVSSTLTCLPWDGGKGGILVFNVDDSLQLNANLDVSGKGFRGGAGFNSGQLVTNCFTNGYYYPLSSGNIAGIKGESISTISNNIIRGKGALAGGGGGGLDHNSGGGGGGNSGTGGFGGYQLEPCGNAPFDNRGIGGKNLVYNNAANKIFMGSGGGAGHANNPANTSFPPSGGNGSGIIIISAQSLISNSFKIMAEGVNAPPCNVTTTGDCHDATGGGGAGGTVLLDIQTFNDNSTVEIKGGKGADMSGSVPAAGRIGPGGGGGGGLFWSSTVSLPANVIVNATGGLNGVLLTDANNAWGATPGNNGTNVFNLQLPVDNIPFKPNIDSVRIKDSITGCASFDFKGFGYINTHPVAGWQWYFGDGNTAVTQNTSHTYSTSGTFTVKLVITDINGCKDSITKDVAATALDIDFSYQLNACSPLTVQFNSVGSSSQNPYWLFGDATNASGILNPLHTYPSENTYIVKYSASNGVCADTVTKTINLAIIPDDIVLTPDTTICFGTNKQLLTKPALSFCWSPTTFLNNPNSPNPITSTPQNITYYYTAEVNGNNLIVNGDFTQGNTGFTSQYISASPNTTEGQYFIGTNPQAWNGGLNTCGDHTAGNGNMMMVNGAPAVDVNVWKQTVTVTPNTNYAFSTWIQAFHVMNPAQLQFSINGKNVGGLITASTPACTWTQFYTTWNSGNNTAAVISIVNKNTILAGNDFGLDDISFAPVFIKRDSVKITVEIPLVRTTIDSAVCPGTPVQLNTTGAASYTWSPPAGLSNAAIPNPIANPATTTEYEVTGTTANGCTAKDTVKITIRSKPAITKSANDTICKNTSVQLFASGGINYTWSPAATLNDPNISNPVASPPANTVYYVTVTDANTCTNTDSVKIRIHPDPVFSISPPDSVCEKGSAQLNAAGGDIYSWQPNPTLSSLVIKNPVATPAVTTTYFVNITETACNNTATLTTTIHVNATPNVRAGKANDIDCSNDRSQLNATGAETYTWSPAATLSNPNISNPVAMPTGNIKYVVKGTDTSGCSNYDSVMVNFLSVNASGYFMPNAFTPNYDGKNDCYGIRFWGIIQQLEFSIYNRWGERIFFTKDPHTCWDGIYKGKMQDIGVYVYMIKAKTLCGDTFRKGLFTLVR